VVFIKKPEPFAALKIHQYQCEKKYDIYFGDGKIYAQFRCSFNFFFLILFIYVFFYSRDTKLSK